MRVGGDTQHAHPRCHPSPLTLIPRNLPTRPLHPPRSTPPTASPPLITPFTYCATLHDTTHWHTVEPLTVV